jgi:MtrB/PioB family decaheme-associated outer membrane protein
MTNLRFLRVSTLASVCLISLVAAHAQDNSGFDVSDAPVKPDAAVPQNLSASMKQITVGIGGVSDSSPVFGRYNGMPSSGVGALGSWNWQIRDPADSGGTHYFITTGDNVNFGLGRIAPEATLTMKVGDQGTWSLAAVYDATTYTASDSFLSILDKHGMLSSGYHAALVANGDYFTNATTAPPASAKFGSFNASTHLASANPVTSYGPGNQLLSGIGTRRDKGTVEGDYDLESWKLSAIASHEHKEGTLEQAMTTGGNNAGMVTFPMPINYDTDTFIVAAAYTTPELQAKFSYEFSNFADNNSAGFVFQGWNFSAFKNTTVTPNTYTSYARSGDYSLPPSNQAHTFKAEAGYNIDATTRLYADAIYGIQMQNDTFPAATELGYVLSNPTLSAQLATNPRSLGGFVQTFFGNMTLTSRPFANADVKVSYTIDLRDPQTSAMWIYGNPTDNTSLKYREAVPESWTKQTIVVTAGYRVLPSTRVTVGYAYRDAHRGNAITHEARENEASVKLVSTITEGIEGALDYVHSDRTASAPDWKLWLVQIPSDCGSTLAALGCQQVPFYEAARTQDAVSGRLTGALDPDTTFSLIGKYTNDIYHNPAATYNATVNPSLGINRDYTIQAGPDLAYRFSPDTEIHAYYTFLRTFRAMRALNDQVSPTTAGQFYYSEASTYDIHTAGIGGTWHYSDTLKFGADYVFSYGNQRFAQSGSWDTNEAGQTYGGDPLLSNQSANHQFKIHATYDYTADTSFYLSYQFDSLSMTDWALVGPTVGQVLTGDLPPKYGVSTVMAAMTLRL